MLINAWPVVASMVISMVLGFIWYGPLFGKKWMALSGITMPDTKPSFAVMLKPMAISLVGAFLMSSALSFSIAFHNAYYSTSGIMTDLSFAFVLWLGFIVPAYLNFVAWEQKSGTITLINTGYWLVFLSISAALISLFA